MNPVRHSEALHAALSRAGWFEGRRVGEMLAAWKACFSYEGAFQWPPLVDEILLEFGGLTIGESGPGLEAARMEVEVDPTIALGEEDRFAQWYELVGALYPLGGCQDRYAFLAIDERGRIFIVLDNLFFVGASFDAALGHLVVGKKAVLIEAASDLPE